jgi:hypothetical protein
MCAMCDGQGIDEFMADVIGDIERVGWAVIAVEDERGEHVHTYTAGLTRYHGHPELIFSGAGFHTAHYVLDVLADAVSGGRRLAEGQVLTRDEIGRECLLVPVADPSLLVLAQAVYGGPTTIVPALQVVWSDEAGRWPWELCDEHRGGQEVHGMPVLPRES